MAAYLVVVGGFDNFCHFSIVANYLRGNIPPTALNDPTAPLIYHGLYDAAGALLTRAFGADIELGLDLGLDPGGGGLPPRRLGPRADAVPARSPGRLAGAAVPAAGVWSHLPAVLRRSRLQRLRPARPDQPGLPGADAPATLPGELRGRLPDSRPDHPAGQTALAPARPCWRACWRRASFSIPQIAEEQLLVLGLLVAALVLGRRLSLVAGVAAAVGALAGGAFSGVFRSLLEPTTSMASPRVALLWPPALPNWQVPHGGAGFPSWLLLEVVLLEVGPLIAVAFVLLCRERSAAHRIVLSAIVLDLLAASCLTLRNWPRADLDRFVFHAANLTLLFLPALWGLSIVRRRRPWARRAILALTGLLLVAGSLPTAVDRFYTQARRFSPDRPGATLRPAAPGARRRGAARSDRDRSSVGAVPGHRRFPGGGADGQPHGWRHQPGPLRFLRPGAPLPGEVVVAERERPDHRRPAQRRRPSAAIPSSPTTGGAPTPTRDGRAEHASRKIILRDMVHAR